MKKIFFGSSTPTLNGNEEANIYFSNQVVLNPMEVSGNASMEVIFHAVCN